MRNTIVLTLSALVLACCASTVQAQSSKPAATPTPVDAKTIEQVLSAEQRLADAIRKRDSVALNQLLSEDYTSSREGGDWALSKRGALVRCGAGKLTSYLLGRHPRFSRDRQAITIEADAEVVAPEAGKAETTAKRVDVRHWWFLHEQRWLLAAQLIQTNEAEPERETSELN